MIKYLVVCKSVNPADKPRYRLFTREDKAKAFVATLSDTTTAEIHLLREDEE